MAGLKEKLIGVLAGGPSGERDVSLATGRAVADALESLGYRLIEIDPGPDVAEKLLHEGVDLVFNALHGRWGEDGCLQGVLEWLKIPYTGSGVLSSALAMDKVAAKRVFRQAGLPVPMERVVKPGDASSIDPDSIDLQLPLVVKPAREGSSLGVTVVRERKELRSAIDDAASFGGDVLVEEFIPGGEFSVGILNDEALGVIEIVPSKSFYDYEAKYADDAGTDYVYPARLPQRTRDLVAQMGLAAFRALKCEGYARVDFLVQGEKAVLLEVNTLPGMTGHSLLPMIAKGEGIGFPKLCEKILESARLKG
ncbi:MAG: D-alanine--D-alanine ligase [Deltaproteobacteria bacterium]|nr:D-alanine--D-alanine ligase [Deltaproteobacteria bacterium]